MGTQGRGWERRKGREEVVAERKAVLGRNPEPVGGDVVI
jgi:hypothetical protein